MSEIDTAMNLMFKSLGMGNELISTGLNIVNLFIKPIDQSPENKMWNTAIERGQVNVIPCHGDDMKALIDELEKKHIPYKAYHNMVMVLKADYQQVQDVINLGDWTQTGMAPVEERMKDKSEKGMYEVIVGSPEEAVLVQARLDNNNVTHAITQEGFGSQYKIVVADVDKENLNRAIFDMSIDLQGEYGEILKKELGRDELYKLNVLENIGDTTKNKEPLYVVDVHGASITSDASSAVFKGPNGETVSEKKGRANKKDDLAPIAGKFLDMKMPTKLTKEEYGVFSTLNSDKERQDFIIEKRREQGIGTLSKEELDIVIKHEKQRSLIEAKLRQEHPSEIVADANDYNNEQPLALFVEAEKQNYEMSHDLASLGNIDATILNVALMEYKGYDIDAPEIDYDELAEVEDDIFHVQNRPDWLDDFVLDAQNQDKEVQETDEQEI